MQVKTSCNRTHSKLDSVNSEWGSLFLYFTKETPEIWGQIHQFPLKAESKTHGSTLQFSLWLLWIHLWVQTLEPGSSIPSGTYHRYRQCCLALIGRRVLSDSQCGNVFAISPDKWLCALMIKDVKRALEPKLKWIRVRVEAIEWMQSGSYSFEGRRQTRVGVSAYPATPRTAASIAVLSCMDWWKGGRIIWRCCSGDNDSSSC